MVKKALITGITGQTGSYLAEFLLENGYEVHGIIRQASSLNIERIYHLYNDPNIYEEKLFLHYADLSESSSLYKILEKVEPNEIYNLAAQSHVQVSFNNAEYTGDINGIGAVRLLESIKNAQIKTKFYQASTSEMYGKAIEIPQNELTPFYPRSPYAIAKLYAHWITINYRESYNMFNCTGILFNHESPRRGESFVTKKITKAIARILAGKQRIIKLGNLDAKRDWGYAKDYIEAMWLMLQQDKPDDYVIATGKSCSIKEFLSEAFSLVNMNWEKYVEIDPQCFRPSEVDHLVGDASKAKEKLGWTPTTSFKELVKIMLEYDLKAESILKSEESLCTDFTDSINS